MPGLDEIRRRKAQLESELVHLSTDITPLIHSLISAQLTNLRQAEQREVVLCDSQLPKPPHPSEVEEKRQRQITALRSGIPALQTQLAHIPHWDTARREQIEGTIAEYKSQAKSLEEQAV